MASRTALQVLTSAFRRLNILEETESLNAEQSAEGLVALNGMLHGFDSMGIAYAHSDLALTDTLNVPDGQVRNVVLMLAEELAPDYERPISPTFQMQIDGACRALQAHYMVVPPAQIDIGLVNRLASGRSTDADDI